MIEIREAADSAGMKRFVAFPYELYRGDPVWVPPLISEELRILDPRRNPTFEFCRGRYWLAIREGATVGRIAGFVNEHENERRGQRLGRFGLADFIDDPAVSRALFERVEEWARDEGAERLEGPLGLGSFDRNAVLIEGFEHLPTAISSYNHPYYAAHFEEFGFEKEIDYLEHRITVPHDLDPKRDRVSKYVLERKRLKLWSASGKRALLKRAREIFRLINDAYADLHDFVALTDKEIDFLISRFIAAIDPEFIKIVVDEEDTIVAVGAAIKSMSLGLRAARGRLLPLGWLKLLRAQRQNDVLDLYLVAVRPELRNSGIPAVLMHEMHKSALKRGLRYAESNGELETNDRVLSMWKELDYVTHKRRRIYRKLLA